MLWTGLSYVIFVSKQILLTFFSILFIDVSLLTSTFDEYENP